MAVRNFYATMKVDGRKTILSGGPQAKTGGMRIEITQRQHGLIVTAFSIQCYVDKAGNLRTNIFDNHGDVVASFTSER